MNTAVLITSPLHMLIGLILCFTNPKTQYSLLLTGRNYERNKRFKDYIDNLKLNNIKTCELIRLQTRNDVIKFLEKHLPDEIITGNDVIHEFVITSYIANKRNILLSYLDDGLYSYNEYSPRKETLPELKNIFRLLFKGYKRPIRHTIGSSPLTKKAYLFLPENAKPSLKEKTIVKIDTSEETRKFIQRCAQAFCNTNNLNMQSIDNMVILPHSKNIIDQKKLIEAIKNHLNKCNDLNKLVMLKNHPSNTNDDFSVIKDIEKHILPNHLPAEILIALFQPKTIYVSNSSIGFIAKLIFPEIKIHSLEEIISTANAT